VGRACGTHGREVTTGFRWESPKEKDHLEDRGVNGGGIKMDLREIGWGGCGVDSPSSG
jgi:hypothetical protein